MADDDDRIAKNDEEKVDQGENDKGDEKTKTDGDEVVNEKGKEKGKSKEVQDEREEVDDEAGEQKDDNPNKDNEVDNEKDGGEETAKQHDWQAVWDATRQAWYFWNQVTQETTWENPLVKEGKNEESATQADSVPANESVAISMTSMTDEEVAQMVGIDPDLAYLDPVMYANEIHQARMGNGNPTSTSYRSQGAFDNRTGKFVSQSALKQGATYDPSRLSHANQADRQMGAFFDVEQYEDQRKREHEKAQLETDEQGRIKRQRPSKKELKFFKERAKEKKASKHAWLRN
ncbi:uncharacterized protein FA14DRAFT_4696 [Meira miltonrushii]|uniref:WW domain-containing protein n=1 Tax=Meira miltonrushii TaxID=1280837 RepID=A0A316VJY3_9BASI|nr:uncharacterized protein FA14DRAFT_4696 [Meira miltonrushii]PWN36613.1 hypothetical protein FA14DRAFT_4696 [Meira miltonrushii]